MTDVVAKLRALFGDRLEEVAGRYIVRMGARSLFAFDSNGELVAELRELVENAEPPRAARRRARVVTAPAAPEPPLVSATDDLLDELGDVDDE